MIHPNTQSLRPESPISGFSAKKFESVSVERILSTQMYCMRWWWKMMQFSSSKNRFLPVFVLFYIQSFFKAMHGPPFRLLKYKYFFDIYLTKIIAFFKFFFFYVSNSKWIKFRAIVFWVIDWQAGFKPRDFFWKRASQSLLKESFYSFCTARKLPFRVI